MKKFDLVRYIFGACSISGLVLAAYDYWVTRRVRLFSWLILVVIGAGLTALVDMYWLEPNWITVETVMVSDSALAERLAGVRVAQISDLHLHGHSGVRENLLLKRLNALNPDLVMITGDIVDDIDAMHATVNLIRGIRAKVGVYAVLGNTDHYHFHTKWLMPTFRESGMHLLMNENCKVSLPNGKGLWLAGVDDPVGGRANIEQALQGIPAGEPVVMLAHAPNIFSKAVISHVNLLLVGHTHGGQVGIPFLIRRSNYANRYETMAGIERSCETTMYINRGIGTKALPIRFLCRPEITLFEFKGQS